MRNVEIKARVESLDAIHERLGRASAEMLVQDDTFFACPNGRLKLREFGDGSGELIHYRRADQAGPKESDYVRVPAPEPQALRAALERGYGIAGRVRKRRRVVMVGRTRVHLDEVEGLGSFVELEVVLRDGEPAQAGIDEAHALMARLGIEPAQLVETAYVDLLAAA